MFDFNHPLIEKTSSCWIWHGAISTGYGSIRIGGISYLAHRLAWEEWNHEPIPPGMVIMHICDQRACVNPNHLELGTESDNSQDAHSKGRACRNGSTKLTVAVVKIIRSSSKTPTELGRYFNVTSRTIHHILAGETWKGVV